MNEVAKLLISLSLDDGDVEELHELSYQLKSEIEQLQINSVEMVSTEKKSEGVKGADFIVIGDFILKLTPVVIPALFTLLKSWVERKPSVPVKIKVKIGKNKTAQVEYDPTKTSAKEIEVLIKALSKSTKK